MRINHRQEWVCGGYHLWMIKNDAFAASINTNNDDIDKSKNPAMDATLASPLESSSSHTIVASASDDDLVSPTSSQIILFNFVKSSLLNNPFLVRFRLFDIDFYVLFGIVT